jgi:NAD(P)-dependent dehydrogenase (short-subunit alcohol dehydrogenase family)
MKRLKDKVAIVTGAADGIGLAISKLFAQEGALVLMCDINKKKCIAESIAINAKSERAFPKVCSVANTGQMERMVKEAIEDFGRIDILVNNAAVAISGNVMDMPENEWDKLMEVNLKGIFRGIKFVLPHMLNHGGGSIISISSMQALRSWDNWTAYAAAKGAINSMTTQLAGQFGADNIRFNAISPGAIMTPMNEKRIKHEGKDYLESSINQSALLRMGLASEVAETAVFLSLEGASFITGQNIHVDGGLGVLPRYFDKLK